MIRFNEPASFEKYSSRFFRIDLVSWTLLSIFFIARGPSITSKALYNPDEAEFLAQGKLASSSLIPYDNFVTSTSGPITPEILGTLSNFGFNLDLRFAHLYSAFVIAGIVMILVKLSGRRNPRSLVLSAFLPITIIWGSGDTKYFGTDLLSLSSEITPLLLLSISLLILIKSDFSVTLLVFLSGMIAGIAFFTKYQIAFLLFIFPILIISNGFDSLEHTYKSVLKCLSTWAFGWIVSLVTLISIIIYSGNRDAFIYSLSIVLNYGSGNISSFSQSSILERLSQYIEIALNSPLLALSIVVLFLLIGMSLQVVRKRNSLPLVVVAALILGYLSSALAGNNFGHYIQLLLWSVALSTALIFRNVQLSNALSVHAKPYLLLLSLPLVALSISASSSNWIQGTIKDSGPNQLTNESQLIDACPSGAQVVVWGWAAELYANNNWTPAPFFVNNAVLLIDKEDLENSFNYRVTEEAFRNPRTKCIVEAIGPEFFGSIDPEIGKIENVSEDWGEILGEEYRLIETSDFQGRVFVRSSGS